jgi:hypothetical protein
MAGTRALLDDLLAVVEKLAAQPVTGGHSTVRHRDRPH